MATGKALDGKPYAGNPHVRFDEGEVAPAAKPRRGSLLYTEKLSTGGGSPSAKSKKREGEKRKAPCTPIREKGKGKEQDRVSCETGCSKTARAHVRRKLPCACSFSEAGTAAAERGGGVVRVEAGEHETKPLLLRNNVTLELSEGAVLLASTNIADYAAQEGGRCFIYAENVTNVAIVGRGTIAGRGWVFKERKGLSGASQPQQLPIMMRFSRCRDVRLEDFTYRDCGAWGCHLQNCDGVAMRRVKCFSHVNNTNDGIDIESSNVVIEDCDIDSDDDALVFKTESDKTFQVTNVVVRNCRLASCCNAVKFGTGSYSDFRDVTIEDCSLVRATANHRFSWWKKIPGVTNRICGIAGLALEVVDGGRMDGVTVRNIEMEGYQTPIFVRLGRRHDPLPGMETYLQNILVENVRGTADSRIASSITGVPGLRPRGITLRNVSKSRGKTPLTVWFLPVNTPILAR